MVSVATGIAPRELLAEPEILEHIIAIVTEQSEAAERDALQARLRQGLGPR